MNQTLLDAGVGFRSVQGDTRFHVDPVPRVIAAEEWVAVKRGLAQRVRALNAFVADAYGDRRIVAEGVVPEYVISSAEYYEPQMRGVEPPGGSWIGIAGLDVVRDGDGEWLVLEDNLRTPSGFAYLHAARIALRRHLDVPPAALPRPLERRDRPARRRTARRDTPGLRRPPRAAGRRAHRRAVELGLLGARLARAHARGPAGGDGRHRAAARAPVVSRRVPDRRRLPAHRRRPARLSARRAAARAVARRDAGADQPVRDGRRRRQAHARLRRRHHPLLPRRGAGRCARSRPTTSRSPTSSSVPWRSSTSSCSSRGPVTAASAC